MKKLTATTNPVLLSFIEALLSEADINYMIADQHISNTEGSIALFPRRVLVHDDDLAQAKRVLINAKLDDELELPE